MPALLFPPRDPQGEDVQEYIKLGWGSGQNVPETNISQSARSSDSNHRRHEQLSAPLRLHGRCRPAPHGYAPRGLRTSLCAAVSNTILVMKISAGAHACTHLMAIGLSRSGFVRGAPRTQTSTKVIRVKMHDAAVQAL